MQEAREPVQPDLIESEAVSWWSWRPGVRPLRAFLLGGLLSLLALFLLANGITALLSGILDSTAPPLRVPGTIAGHSKNMLGSPQLTIHLEQSGFPATISLVVSPATSARLANGASIMVDYAQHQHVPYALENAGHLYLLPGTSSSGNLLQTLTLLLCGLLLLPYPALLSFWGWRDLHTGQIYRRTAHVVALRAARQTTTRSPGLVPRTTHIWYGVALQMENTLNLAEPEILTFSVRQELHEQLRRGDRVQATYSPHLHHLYALKTLSSEME